MSKKELDKILFPEISAYQTGYLPVDDTHKIYFELYGNPDGVPVMALHGGPGGGSSPKMARFFDPDHYKIILHDQRGCGKSLPFASLENNTTDHLISDINALADYLKIDNFHVAGGSWGSTLSIAYAQANPKRVLSLTLRGIFLMRQSEIDWFMTEMGAFFPDAYDDFRSIFPDSKPHELLDVFYDALKNGDEDLKKRAATAWSRLEATSCSLIPDPKVLGSCDDPTIAYPISLLEAHYFVHNRFAPDDKLLRDINLIRKIPATIVQGRYDIVCPPRTAHDLHKAWPEAHFVMVPDAGHSSSELGIAKGLIDSSQRFKHI